MRRPMNCSAGLSGHFAAVSSRICCTATGAMSMSQRTPSGYDLIQGISFIDVSMIPSLRRDSDRRQTAVDGERLARDEAAGVAREQRKHALQIFRPADALHR